MVEDLILRLRGIVDASARSMPSLLDRVRRAAQAAVAVIGAVSAAMAAATLSAAAYADGLAKTARSLQVTTEELQALHLAAELAGVGQEQLRIGLATLQRQLYQASRGSAEAARALAAVGLSAEDSTRPVSEVFGDLLDGLRAMPEDARRSGVAMVLLGEAGSRMGTLIEGGAAGIASARGELDRMGALISGSVAADAERLNDAIALLRIRAGALSTALGLRLVPAALRLVDVLDRMVQSAAPVVLRGIEAAARLASAAVDALATPLGQVVASLAGIAASRAALVRLAAFLAIPLSPALSVVAAVAALGGALDDLIVYLQGGNSVIGRVLPAWTDLRAAIGDVVRTVSESAVFADLLTIMEHLGTAVAAFAGFVGGILVTRLQRAWEAMRPLVDGARVLLSLGARAAAVAGGAFFAPGPGGRRPDGAATGLDRVVGAFRSGVRAGSLEGPSITQQIGITVQGVTGEQVAHAIQRTLATEAATAASLAPR